MKCGATWELPNPEDPHLVQGVFICGKDVGHKDLHGGGVTGTVAGEQVNGYVMWPVAR